MVKSRRVDTYVPFDNTTADKQAINGKGTNGGEGIDKTSKEYTISVGYSKVNDKVSYKYTITVDDNAKIYFVDKKGNISESSYKGIYQDDNDFVYAVVEDYLVKTLIVEENKDPDSDGKPELSKDIEVKDVKFTPDVEITYYVEAGKKDLTVSDIKAILADKGCTDISVSSWGWTFTYDGMKYVDVDVDATQVYAVSVKCSNDSTVATSNVKLVAKDGVITVTVKNADGSAFASTYNDADVKGATGTVSKFDQAKDNKSATFDFTFSGLDKDAKLVVTLK